MHDRLRMEYATSLVLALSDADQQDASALCFAFLESLETGGPPLGDPFGTAVSDARFWADCAPLHERVAYGTAALEALRAAALGINTRKRLFAGLWETFSNEDRIAFLSRVDSQGRFTGRAA